METAADRDAITEGWNPCPTSWITTTTTMSTTFGTLRMLRVYELARSEARGSPSFPDSATVRARLNFCGSRQRK